MDSESGIGLELVQRQIALTLYNDLDAAIDEQQSLWQTRDENWAAATGSTPEYVEIEYVAAEHYYAGHKPSLIENPTPSDYPNVAVMCYQGRPSAEVYDQASNFVVNCDIEAMVKGASEAETDARMHRTTEAIHNVLTNNNRLDGLTSGWDNDPVIQITDIFKKREENSYGDEWFWQAVRLRYTTTKHNKLPSWA